MRNENVNNNNGYAVATIYFQNANGDFECNTVLTCDTETIVVGSIFKKDLKGIARTFIDFEIESTNQSDDVAEDFDRDETLEDLFADLQNKGLGTIREAIKSNLNVDVNFDAERQACRTAIRDDIANGREIPMTEPSVEPSYTPADEISIYCD